MIEFLGLDLFLIQFVFLHIVMLEFLYRLCWPNCTIHWDYLKRGEILLKSVHMKYLWGLSVALWIKPPAVVPIYHVSWALVWVLAVWFRNQLSPKAPWTLPSMWRPRWSSGFWLASHRRPFGEWTKSLSEISLLIFWWFELFFSFCHTPTYWCRYFSVLHLLDMWHYTIYLETSEFKSHFSVLFTQSI